MPVLPGIITAGVFWRIVRAAPHLVCGAILVGIVAVLAAANSHVPPVLAIVTRFEGPHSDRAIQEMEGEAGRILSPSGLRVDWRRSGEAFGRSYDDLVVVSFKGDCRVSPVPYVYDELGPLAFAYSADSTVEPFSQVACDKVVRSVRSAMWGSDFARADLLLGRALGRVVVHELIHMLSKSGHHAQEGIGRPALSPKELIGPSPQLSQEDLALLRGYAMATVP